MVSKDKDPFAAAVASSVVLKGIDARTFHEMESFVKDLESRPTERLMRDLAQLASLSVTKFSLVSYVIVMRFRQSDSETRNLMREGVAAASEAVSSGDFRERILSILERLR
jgi:hypothetical protein